MINNYKFKQLIDKNEIIKHEKLLFDAFINRTPDPWISNNYKIINNIRLQSPFSLKDQLIFGMFHKNELVLSIALNLNLDKKLQLEYEGFTRNKLNLNKKIAEGITFCTTGGPAPQNFFDLFEEFNNYLNSELKKNKIEEIYGTSSTRLKIFYLRMNFKVIDEIKKNNDITLLLKKIIT